MVIDHRQVGPSIRKSHVYPWPLQMKWLHWYCFSFQTLAVSTRKKQKAKHTNPLKNENERRNFSFPSPSNLSLSLSLSLCVVASLLEFFFSSLLPPSLSFLSISVFFAFPLLSKPKQYIRNHFTIICTLSVLLAKLIHLKSIDEES